MAVSVGQSGVWKTMLDSKVGVSGVWKQVVGMWVGVGGVWKFVWAPIDGRNVSAFDTAVAPANAYAYIQWSNDGTFDKNNIQNQFNWLAGGTASDYEIYFTATGDTLDGSSSARNTWLNMGTNRSLALGATTVIAKSASGTYQIRHAASLTSMANGTWTLDVEKNV